MSDLEGLALFKDAERSTSGRAFFTGNISVLAQKTGYLQTDSSGRPRSQGGGWLYTSLLNGGEHVPEGYLDFNFMRLRDALVANRLLETGFWLCKTSFYLWPPVVEFRKVDPTAEDVVITRSALHNDGTLSEKISHSHGALALNVVALFQKPDGTLVRGPPGVMSYPESWVEYYGSPVQKGLGIWYSYVDGKSQLGASSKYSTAFAVLGDILTFEHEKPRLPSVAYSHDHSRYAINLALLASEVQDWVASSFGSTLYKLMDDDAFKQAVVLRERQTSVQFSDIGPRYDGITSALLVKDPMPEQLPRDLAGVMGVYTRTHYKPLVERLVEKVHADADMTRMVQLL